MRYNTLGTTGLVVSRMAFGAMTFTQLVDRTFRVEGGDTVAAVRGEA